MNAHISENIDSAETCGPVIEIRLREDLLNRETQAEADRASLMFDRAIRRFETADVSHLIAVFVYARSGEGSDPEITIATLDEVRELASTKPTGMHYLGYAAMFDADAREYFADCGGDYRVFACEALEDELREVIALGDSATMAPR